MVCFAAPMVLGLFTTAFRKKVHAKLHIGWLNTMLWGGVAMLAVEHIAHKEIMFYPPFFSAGISEMLPEIVQVGIPMTLLIVGIWGAAVVIANWIDSRRPQSA